MAVHTPAHGWPMRYGVTFNNGFWKVFDNHAFRDVAKHYTEKQAFEDCGSRNASALVKKVRDAKDAEFLEAHRR